MAKSNRVRALTVISMLPNNRLQRTALSRRRCTGTSWGGNEKETAGLVMLKGCCVGGRVQYRVHAPLRAARSCHCSRCRKAFSGAGSAYAEIAPGSFVWESGEDNLTSYESVPGWGLCFCRTCGTTLCGTHDGKVQGVTLGSVEGDPGV